MNRRYLLLQLISTLQKNRKTKILSRNFQVYSSNNIHINVHNIHLEKMSRFAALNLSKNKIVAQIISFVFIFN